MELDHLEGFLHDEDVPGGEVVDVTGEDHFVVIDVLDAQATLDHVAPMRALAAAVGKLGGEEVGGVADGDTLDGNVQITPLRLAAGEGAGDLHRER